MDCIVIQPHCMYLSNYIINLLEYYNVEILNKIVCEHIKTKNRYLS